MTTNSVTTPGSRHSFLERVRGALLLDAATYEEVEHDRNALREAAAVVGLAAIAGAIGLPAAYSGGVISSILGISVGWLISTAVVWLVGVRFLGHTSDYEELLRTLGFASAPNILAIIGILPGLGRLTPLVSIWALVAYVIAVRQALDVSTGRAIVVCLLAYAALVLSIVLFSVLAAVVLR